MRRKADWMERLKSKNGTTLAELLLTILIVGMVISLITAGVRAVRRNFERVADSYDAQDLADALLEYMEEELWCAREWTVCDEPDAYSVEYMDSSLDKQKLLEIEYFHEGSGGRLRVYNRTDDIRETPYAESFYDELFICPLEETDIFSVDESGRGIRVSFGICRADGEILYSVQDILIPMLNE